MQSGLQSTLSNPFALQYVSLILIILTFVAGAFTTESLAVKSEETQKVQKEEVRDLPVNPPGLSNEVGQMAMSDFFIDSRASFNPDKGQALDFVLGSHDLEAELEITAAISPSASKNAELDSLMLSMLRSKVLLDHFAAQDIPLSALKIYVREQAVRNQASVSAEESGLQIRFKHYQGSGGR